MKKTLWIVAIVLLSPAQFLFASEPGGVVIAHSEALNNLSFGREEFGTSLGAREAEIQGLAFDALGRRFQLALESNERLISHAFHGQVPTGVGIYRGRLEGRPDSWVRLVVADGTPRGMVWDGEQMLAIEADGAGSAVIYRLQDVYVEPGTMTCGTSGQPTQMAAVYEDLNAELRDVVFSAPGATEELNIGLVGDFEFTNDMGANAEIELLARINNVDGIFSEQLGVQITAREVETFPDAADPFTTSVPGELLNELASHRASTPAQTAQGITFLFTGRDLDGSTAGIAFLDALCNSRFAVGLSEGWRGLTADSLVAAHEIGHLFGAEHDGEAGSVCVSETGNFLMAPRSNGSDQFSSCSIDTMRPNADTAPCINPMPDADILLEPVGNPPSLLLGDSYTLDLVVSNNGSLVAANVAVSIDIPTNLSLFSIGSDVGNCRSGAGQAICDLGSVAGGASERVTFVASATGVGSGALDASVTADADTDMGNNAQTVQIVVNPATDLAIVGAVNASVTVDNTVSIRPSVENLSSLAATDVQFSVTFSSGLRVESASLPGGSCTVSASAVDCQLASVAAQSQVAADIELTGTTVGTQSYSASVSTSDVDRDTGNNSASGTISVSSVGSGNNTDSDSGGGAMSLLLLLFATLLRLRGAFAGPFRRIPTSA